MEKEESLKRLNEFYSFIQYMFDNREYYENLDVEEYEIIIDSKVEELHILDIDFTQLTEEDLLFRTTVDGDLEEITLSELLTFMSDEKKLQLLIDKDKNIIEFAAYIDNATKTSDFVSSLVSALLNTENIKAQEKIKIVKEKILNKANYNGVFIQQLGWFASQLYAELKDKDYEEIQNFWLDLKEPILSNLNLIDVYSMSYLISECPYDEFKTDIMMKLIDEGYLDSYEFDNFFEHIKDIDNRIEISNRATLYDIRNNTCIFSLSHIEKFFEKCDKVEHHEQAEHLVNGFLKLVNNGFLGIYVSDSTFLSFFEAFNNDELLINSFSEIIKDSKVQDIIGEKKEVLLKFVNMCGEEYQERALKELVDNYFYDLDQWKNLHEALNVIKSDDLKINLILEDLKKGHYNDDILNGYISTLTNVDKQLELARDIVLLGERANKDYFKTFMLNLIIMNSTKVEKKETADNISNILMKISDDDKLKGYIDRFSFKTFFGLFDNDKLLLESFNEMVKNPFLAETINSDKFILLDFISAFKTDKIKIQVLDQFISEGNYSFPSYDIKNILKSIENKELLLDYDLMKNIYTKVIFDEPIVSFYKEQNIELLSIFKEEEKNYLETGQLEQLLEKYRTVGIIDNATITSVFEIGKKYIKGLTLEETFKRIGNSPNAKSILEKITMTRGELTFDDVSVYEKQLQKFAAIFSKTRFGALPDSASFNKMDVEMCGKFNLKTWRELIQLPLFNKDDNTKRALVEVIAMAGLFENDSEVEVRKRQIINTFSKYDIPLKNRDAYSFGREQPIVLEDFLEPCKIKVYKLREGINLPENLSGMLSSELSSQRFARIMKQTGNSASMLTKFISPYAKQEGVWRLRTGVSIDDFTEYLKTEMTEEEYRNVLHSEKTPKEVINFLNPFEEVKEEGYRIRKDLSESDLSIIINEIYNSDIAGRYTFDSIHRLFDGVELKYDPEFYQFFLGNQDEILESEHQGRFKEVRKDYQLIKGWYLERGNNNPSYDDMIAYLSKRKYNYDFGNEEFSDEVAPNNVSQEGYSFYEGLLKETRQRHLTTIPRHEKVYTYVSEDGKEYQVMAKVLRADDPFNLLVGETKFTNCCQRYGLTGEKCMVHASTSQNGGIFATYLIENGKLSMLTQSWIWSNESRLCLDNIEATDVLKQNEKGRKLMEDIATFAITESCKEMMETSKVTIEKYIEEKTRRINNSSMSDEEKQQELEKLEVVRRRQIIKEITVGDGCDDLHVKQSFPEIISESLSYGPKGYTGYRDSTGDEFHKQHVIVKSSEKTLPIDNEYEDIPIYKDERQIKLESGHEIRNYTLRKIADIETEAHKPEMRQYSRDGSFKITSPTLLARQYGCNVEDLRVIHGEDWYYVYSDDGQSIEVYDLAKKIPRIEDEGRQQTTEMSRAFEKILSEAVVLDEDGNLSMVKPIKADLREDTSYLLYLMQKRKGIIEQVGEDMAYSFTTQGEKTVITEEQQKQILSNMSEIREKENPDLMMHRVEFRPTAKTVEKILSEQTEEIKDSGRKL